MGNGVPMEKIRNLSIRKTIFFYLTVTLTVCFLLSALIMNAAERTQERVWLKYIDQDVAIDSFRLGLSLDDEILPDYRGKATICLTEDSVMTKKVGNFERDFRRTKSQCLNDFLDIFLAVNFVKVLQQDEEIAVASQILNNLVTEKGFKLSRHGMFKGKKMFIFS